MSDKNFLIDDEPSSARDIIKLAKEYNSSYGSDGLCTTSEGANILRLAGHTVKDNREHKTGDNNG
jgi:hypothetical protein